MNFGLYLPLLAGLAFCNQCRRPDDSQAAALALPAAIAMGLATAIMLLLGGGLLALADSARLDLPLPLSAILSQAASALLLTGALPRLAAGEAVQLGLRWPMLLLNSLVAGLPLSCLPSTSSPLASLLTGLLSAALFTLLLAQFATLPPRLQRCALPVWLRGRPALLLCALIIALALHGLGARLS
ncbi:Rnf-Nqr domain containing protein [Aquitalea aquatilis]|uniref:Rnf-Nqr domain containing protein n=1 Tax=Aquitalea aquatilis TaxID=1537400 RepID=UPI00143D5351|nr:Rnf-Nqr domain containing protein [Aquitalea aquatilis]